MNETVHRTLKVEEKNDLVKNRARVAEEWRMEGRAERWLQCSYTLAASITPWGR